MTSPVPVSRQPEAAIGPAAIVDGGHDRPVLAQVQPSDPLDSSPRVLAQGAMNAQVQQSPRMALQRRQVTAWGNRAPVPPTVSRNSPQGGGPRAGGYGPVAVPVSRPSYVAQLLTDEKYIDTKNYGGGYYQYEHDDSGNIDDFSNNRATSKPIGKDPVDSSTLVDLEIDKGSGEGEMKSGKKLDILEANRSQHFSMADKAIDGSPEGRKGSYTWHHLTPPFKMVLVDMAVHSKFGHKGGYSLWG